MKDTCHYATERIIESESGLPLRVGEFCGLSYFLKRTPCTGEGVCNSYMSQEHWQAKHDASLAADWAHQTTEDLDVDKM